MTASQAIKALEPTAKLSGKMLVINSYHLSARMWTAQWNGCTRSDPKDPPSEGQLSSQSGDTL